MGTPLTVVSSRCWSGTRPYFTWSSVVGSRSGGAFPTPAYTSLTCSGGYWASLLALVSRSARTKGGGWGAPPVSWSDPPSVSCWSKSAGRSTCGIISGIQQRDKVTASSLAESSRCTHGFGVLPGWPPANSSRLWSQSCACGGGVPSWTPRWVPLYALGIISSFGVSIGMSLSPSALQCYCLLQYPCP